ncbi:MAG: serine/threonine protein kinase [Gammaproteobacteria bacterium]|nr:serine/threonine protein kinase [Gammaproteobacteria bacterium]
MAAAPATLPFAGLLPDTILDAISSIDLVCDGRLLALNSYENRVYQIGIDDSLPLIAKFYRNGRWSDDAILEEHAFTQELLDNEIPVLAPIALHGVTLHRYQEFRFALYRRQGGRTPELGDTSILQMIGRYLGRMHAVGAVRGFRHRPALDLVSFGEQPRQYLLDHGWLPPALAEVWRSVVDQALVEVRACFARAGTYQPIRLHGDCHAGNLLWSDAGPHFVDFDDARMGPAVQDLWLLLSGDRVEQTVQLGAVLDGYETFHEFEPRELHLIEALRTLRLLHHAAWLAARWSDPAFPPAFPWFASARFWEQQILELREQIALMQEPPLAV